MEVTCEIERSEAELDRLSCSLCCSVCILQQLIRMQALLDSHKYDLLCSAFSSHVYNKIDQVCNARSHFFHEITEQYIKNFLF